MSQALGLSLAQFDALPTLERDLRVADWEKRHDTHEACGFPFSVCGDPKAVFYPYRRVDYAQMEQAGAHARYAALHEDEPYHNGLFSSWAKDRSRSHPYHYGDGVDIRVAETDVAPWDKFTTKRNASPLPPTDEQTSEVSRGDEA